MQKKRHMGLEILRVLSMIFILILHYLKYSGLLDHYTPFVFQNHLVWLLEAFSIVAVNCYVLISGYFLIHSKFHFKKLLSLIMEVWFYSITLYLIFVLSGMTPFSIKACFYALFPLTMSQYWFMTVYVGLYLLFPFINKLIHVLSKKQFQRLLLISILLFSLWNSFIPIAQTLDNERGYGIIWFIVLYFIGAYIKLYLPKLPKKKWCFLIYFISSLVLMLSPFVIYNIPIAKALLYPSYCFNYNFILVLVSSVCLFIIFLQMDVKKEIMRKWISKISSHSLAVYLIHMHTTFLIFLWPAMNVYEKSASSYWFFYMLFDVLFLFILSILIEYIRQKLFSLIENRKKYTEWCEKISLKWFPE